MKIKSNCKMSRSDRRIFVIPCNTRTFCIFNAYGENKQKGESIFKHTFRHTNIHLNFIKHKRIYNSDTGTFTASGVANAHRNYSFINLLDI